MNMLMGFHRQVVLFSLASYKEEVAEKEQFLLFSFFNLVYDFVHRELIHTVLTLLQFEVKLVHFHPAKNI